MNDRVVPIGDEIHIVRVIPAQYKLIDPDFEIVDRIDTITLGADRIHVTCPLGTSFSGGPGDSLESGNDVVIDRFPMGIPRPVINDGFFGKVVLARNLTPTGSRIYHPDTLTLHTPVTAHFEGNRITGLTGPADMVRAVTAHYQHIADAFDLDGW